MNAGFPVPRLLIAAALALAPTAARGQASALRLSLNLPAYRLDAYAGDSLALSMRVAIGSGRYRTPVGRFAIRDITWNPWWYPPRAEWARNDTITPPCPINPMGVVKLSFGNGYFIHGTPSPGSIGRAASHGCVRADNQAAQSLAELIVASVQSDALPAVRGWASSPLTRTLRLRESLPLEIHYDLVEVRGDSVHLYPDVYGRASATATRERIALRALAAAGITADLVDRQALRAAIARSRRAHDTVALDALRLAPLAERKEQLFSGGPS